MSEIKLAIFDKTTVGNIDYKGRNTIKPTNPNAHTYANKQPNLLRHSYCTFGGLFKHTPCRAIFVKHSYDSLLQAILQSCRTHLLWDSLMEHFCVTLLLETLLVTRQVFKTSISSKSHASSLESQHFVRDFLQLNSSSLQNDRLIIKDVLER